MLVLKKLDIFVTCTEGSASVETLHYLENGLEAKKLSDGTVSHVLDSLPIKLCLLTTASRFLLAVAPVDS